MDIHPSDKFGRITIIALPQKVDGYKGKVVQYRCDCGTIKYANKFDIVSGKVTSCGCAKTEKIIQRSTKHGKAKRNCKSRLYQTWQDMKKRCYIESTTGYENYGGRGITICDEWRQDFVVFESWAIAHGYTDKLAIDRIDVNGNYEPDNCRFVDKKSNNRNRRSNFNITAFKETKSVVEWSEDARCLVNFSTLYQRIYKLDWEAERAIATPYAAHHGKRS